MSEPPKTAKEEMAQQIVEGVGLPAEQRDPSENQVPSRWWIVELWDESRGTFKALITHALIFLSVIALFILIHYVLEQTNLPPHRKEILDTVDFWSIYAALLIFSVGFIIELIVLTISRLFRINK